MRSLIKAFALLIMVTFGMVACNQEQQDSAVDSAIEATKEAASDAVEATDEGS